MPTYQAGPVTLSINSDLEMENKEDLCKDPSPSSPQYLQQQMQFKKKNVNLKKSINSVKPMTVRNKKSSLFFANAFLGDKENRVNSVFGFSAPLTQILARILITVLRDTTADSNVLHSYMLQKLEERKLSGIICFILILLLFFFLQAYFHQKWNKKKIKDIYAFNPEIATDDFELGKDRDIDKEEKGGIQRKHGFLFFVFVFVFQQAKQSKQANKKIQTQHK